MGLGSFPRLSRARLPSFLLPLTRHVQPAHKRRHECILQSPPSIRDIAHDKGRDRRRQLLQCHPFAQDIASRHQDMIHGDASCRLAHAQNAGCQRGELVGVGPGRARECLNCDVETRDEHVHADVVLLLQGFMNGLTVAELGIR